MISSENSTSAEETKGPEVFFDGECPLCRKEINLLRKLDRKKTILFTDITLPDFKAEDLGKTHDELMAEIHGKTPDGELIIGVEVFRQLYGAIGLNWLMPVTRLPGIRHLLDWSYVFFAKNRLRFTGRCKDQVSCPLDSTPMA